MMSLSFSTGLGKTSQFSSEEQVEAVLFSVDAQGIT